MRIIKLQAENVKRLSVVEIEPDGSMVVISGKNGAGKTCVIDSVAYTLGGKDLICEQPLRRGEKRGKGVVTFDNGVKVTRTFTESGGGLKVENAEGVQFKSPQAMLSALVGPLSFDPLEFTRMDPKRQMETLKALMGLDFAGLDSKRAELYEERTGVNRSTKQLEAKLTGLVLHPEAPAKEVSIAGLTELLEEANTEAQRIDGLRSQQTDAQSEARTARQRVEEIAVEIDGLHQQIERLKHDRANWAEAVPTHEQQDLDTGKQIVEAEQTLPDREALRASIANAETVNQQVRQNAVHAEQSSDLDASRAQAVTLCDQIDDLDADKAKQVADAQMPVEGLGFDDGSVLLAGVPFSQASSAEQLRVSVAMGLAMNPTLKLLLIRDGSLLDVDSRRLIAEMAEAAEAQVWMECVEENEATTIVIEDGAVRAAAVKAA